MISNSLTEQCPSIDVSNYKDDIRAPGSGGVINTWSRNGAVVMQRVLRCDRLSVTVQGDTDQRIGLSWTRCNYGGERPWFLCPTWGCGRRVRKLYTRDGIYFRCRRCLDLRYASQYEDSTYRALSQLRSIRARLGGTTDITLPFPGRPSGMHRRTYEGLREQAQRHERRYLDGMVVVLERLTEYRERSSPSATG